MARARNIKPGFFVNPDLIDCSYPARLLYIGLWCLADKEGRLEDEPRKIRLQIFPGDDVDVDSLLGELSSRNFVKRYEALGKRCVFIPNFRKHQNPHKNETDSVLPPYQEFSDTIATLPEGSGNYQSAPASLLILPSLNPDSLNPSSLTPESPLSERIEGGLKPFEEEKAKGGYRPSGAYSTFGEWSRAKDLDEVPDDWLAMVRGCAKGLGLMPSDVPSRAEKFWTYYTAGKGKDFTSDNWSGKFWEWFKNENGKGV